MILELWEILTTGRDACSCPESRRTVRNGRLWERRRCPTEFGSLPKRAMARGTLSRTCPLLSLPNWPARKPLCGAALSFRDDSA
jgi:hypothetical protein